MSATKKYAPVAQLDRAFDYESKGYEFDSCPAHHYRDVAQLGSALDLGSRGHRFESCHPDHYYGEVAQLARAIGSYPEDRGFESHPRYHYLSERLTRHSCSRTLSSVGQSCRLITDWSKVRVLQGPLWRSTQVVEGSGLENR